MEEHFNNQLSHFVKDFACKNEVIAKFKNKKPISQIVKEMTFPISEDGIIQMIWEYLIEKNIVLLYSPSSKENEQYDIVKKVGEFGKSYFEKVKTSSVCENDYEMIDMAKIKQDIRELDKYSYFVKELIEKMPFESKTYYIMKDFIK